MKGGYKEFEELAPSIAEPIIAEPEIHGGIELDESCRFLLLMSRGLYKSLEEATGATDQVNKELALIAVEQVRHYYILIVKNNRSFNCTSNYFYTAVSYSVDVNWCGSSSCR